MEYKMIPAVNDAKKYIKYCDFNGLNDSDYTDRQKKLWDLNEEEVAYLVKEIEDWKNNKQMAKK